MEGGAPLICGQGSLLADSDFSAIEARVIAWLAGEERVLEVFRTQGRIYEAAAAQMFHVPIERMLDVPAAAGGIWRRLSGS